MGAWRTGSESALAVAPLVVAAALAAAGCHRADSVLLVEVAGDVTLPVAQLSANVTIGTTTHMLLVPATPDQHLIADQLHGGAVAATSPGR